MWCPSCRQDVPGMASGIDGDLVCVRCGNALVLPETPPLEEGIAEHAFPLSDSDELLGDAWLARSAPFDAFEFDARLGRARHLLRLPTPAQPLELHTAHLEPLPASLRSAIGRGRETAPAPVERSSLSIVSQVAWSAIVLGVAAFVCGAILVGWSLFGDRAELWDLGLPIVLGGQAALVVGLLLQLGRAGEAEDSAREKLDELYSGLDVLAVSQRLARGSSTAPRSYYADIASRSAPDAKLADLQGQLDLLSARVQKRPR